MCVETKNHAASSDGATKGIKVTDGPLFTQLDFNNR